VPTVACLIDAAGAGMFLGDVDNKMSGPVW